MRNNPRIASLFAGLAATGVQHRCNWQTRRDGKKGAPDIEHLAFVGDGFSPSIATAVLIDYDGDGYGLYLEAPSASIDGDVAAIAKPRATEKPSESAALALLREAVEAWPQTERPADMRTPGCQPDYEEIGEINGGDMVEWWGGFYGKALAVLAGAEEGR